jgi:ABC-type branched-subunit amino acid transport system substrate-binding protein
MRHPWSASTVPLNSRRWVRATLGTWAAAVLLGAATLPALVDGGDDPPVVGGSRQTAGVGGASSRTAAGAGSTHEGEPAPEEAGGAHGDGAAADDPGSDGGGGGPAAEKGSAAGAAPPAGAAPFGALGATDVGVTPETIKVGFLLLDVGGVSRIGISVPGLDPAQQRAAFEAQLADVNERGGIHGRAVVGVYEKFEALNPDDHRRACLALRDQKVFAVVAGAGYPADPSLCITKEGRTPLVTTGGLGMPTEFLRRSDGLLFSMYPDSDRTMGSWVADLHRQGVLAGKRIGIVSQEDTNPGDTVIGGGLLPALQRFGYTAAHVSRLAGDQSTAASQVPVEVQKMKAANVDLVFLTTSMVASTQFVQTADSQRYWPRYTITDWGSMNSDTPNQSMPDSYDGTLAITFSNVGDFRVGNGENAEEQRCRRVYETHTGKELDQKGSNEFSITMQHCTTLHALLLGLAATGPELTRPALSRGMQSIGTLPMSVWGGGSLTTGKFSAADALRTMRWSKDCRCLMPVDEFRQSAY